MYVLEVTGVLKVLSVLEITGVIGVLMEDGREVCSIRRGRTFLSNDD